MQANIAACRAARLVKASHRCQEHKVQPPGFEGTFPLPFKHARHAMYPLYQETILYGYRCFIAVQLCYLQHDKMLTHW